jgi:hypothetical protein
MEIESLEWRFKAKKPGNHRRKVTYVSVRTPGGYMMEKYVLLAITPHPRTSPRGPKARKQAGRG